jgi:LysR family transcriptional regulator, hydrogen peroxide-inducible genes activator
MEMHQIRYFLAVSELLNFREAAEKCHVSAPALSRAIQKLEEEVGGKLIHRERNRTHLTDLGNLIRPHLERVLSEAAGAKITAERFLRLEQAPLRLGIMCTIGPIQFTAFLARFHAKQTGVELTLIDGTSQKLNELLSNGMLDLAIMAQSEPFPESYQVIPLYQERFCVGFPLGHRFESRKLVKLIDAIGEPHLLRVNCEFQARFLEHCHNLGSDLQVVYRSEREDWIQSMIAAGLGITFLPESSVLIPGLVLRPLIEPETVREISLVSIAGRSWSPAIETFIRATQLTWLHGSS